MKQNKYSLNCQYWHSINFTCIFTLPSSSLILNVENEAPIVGAISAGLISQMYCLMRLLLPTPRNQINYIINYSVPNQC